MRLRIAAALFLATTPLFGQETYNKYHHGLPDERRPPNIPFRRGTVSVEPSQLYEEIPLAPAPVFILPHREMKPQKIAALSQVRIPGPGGAAPAAGGPTITVTSAVCVANTATATANCTLGASGAVGDLLIVRSKTQSSVAATVAYSFSGTSSCTLTTVNAATFQVNGASNFMVASAGCIITTAGANIPVSTWTGGTASFTDIEAFTVHTTTSWKTTFVDQVQTSAATVAGVTCPTGATASPTTNANDFILATCDVFNVGQTQGGMAGFTAITGAFRNTSLSYYQVVTSTGTQSATVPLSGSDFGVGMIAAFASN